RTVRSSAFVHLAFVVLVDGPSCVRCCVRLDVALRCWLGRSARYAEAIILQHDRAFALAVGGPHVVLRGRIFIITSGSWQRRSACNAFAIDQEAFADAFVAPGVAARGGITVIAGCSRLGR